MTGRSHCEAVFERLSLIGWLNDQRDIVSILLCGNDYCMTISVFWNISDTVFSILMTGMTTFTVTWHYRYLISASVGYYSFTWLITLLLLFDDWRWILADYCCEGIIKWRWRPLLFDYDLVVVDYCCYCYDWPYYRPTPTLWPSIVDWYSIH